MPGYAHAPRPGLLTAVDLESWAGASVFDRVGGAPAVSLSSLTAMAAAGAVGGRYEDMIAFLNGYGSGSGAATDTDLSSDANTQWVASGAAGTLAVGIDADDRVYVHASAVAFTLTAPAGNPWGFPAGATASVASGGGQRVTATAEWTRGNVVITNTATQGLEIDPIGAPAAFTIPTYAQRVQSVPTMLRGGTTPVDADSGWIPISLEYLDNASGATIGRPADTRWGLTDDGYVYWSQATAAGAVGDTVWTSTTFRDRLGYDGTEGITTTGGLSYSIAINRCPGVWLPRRGLSGQRTWRTETGATLSLAGGGVSAVSVGAATGHEIDGYYGLMLDSQDDEFHLRDRFWQYAPLGWGLNLYQQWGDPRRALRGHQAVGSQAAYDLLYTSEREGRRGRLRCVRDPDDQAERIMDREGELHLRGRFTLRLRDR